MYVICMLKKYRVGIGRNLHYTELVPTYLSEFKDIRGR